MVVVITLDQLPALMTSIREQHPGAVITQWVGNELRWEILPIESAGAVKDNQGKEKKTT